MVAVTSLEKGLKRLLGLCPTIVLKPEDIQLIIDGKQNEVIAKHKGTYVAPVLINVDDGTANAPTVNFEDINETSSNDKSFDEYFMTKQED